jgi:ParB-like chromosome segregation protein Spo0J
MNEPIRHRSLAIEMIDLSALRPYAKNARHHSRAQIKQIAKSIEAFGFTNPILVSDDLEILAGHGRAAAARLIGLKQAPIVRLSDLSPAERKAYVLADNKLALNAGWDREVLAIELQGLIDLNFDVEATGFALGEIEVILDEAAEAAPKDPMDGAEDEIPLVGDAAVSRSGDVWRAGRHRLVCGDARDAGAYESLLGNERADLIFSDRLTTSPLTATSAALAAFAIGNSRWARERCPRQSLRSFWNRPSALRPSGAEMEQSLLFAWTGGTRRSFWPLAKSYLPN